MASVLRTLLASLLILVAGVITLAAGTDGFRAYTAETARRLDIQRHPRAVPNVALQQADGQTLRLAELRGRWLLVDFIYTNCLTYCSVQGNEFAQLQDRMAQSIARHDVALLSISFDPRRDGPDALAAYKQRSGDRGAGWIAARPTNREDLQTLMDVFGVTAIDDGMGGYVHNAAIAVVNPAGQLVTIVDWDQPGQAEQYVRDRRAG